MSNQPIRAKLIRIDVPIDWYDLRKQSTFVYQTDAGEECVSEDYVPIDCREVGKEYELIYTYFSIGNAEGYNWQPRSLTPVSHEKELPW